MVISAHSPLPAEVAGPQSLTLSWESEDSTTYSTLLTLTTDFADPQGSESTGSWLPSGTNLWHSASHIHACAEFEAMHLCGSGMHERPASTPTPTPRFALQM